MQRKRKIGREDLSGANPFWKERDPHGFFWWGVYEDYELVEQDWHPSYVEASNSKREYYLPLVDTPHLFLEFARIAEHREPEKALGLWTFRYGLLGLTPEAQQVPSGEFPEVTVPPLKYKDSGGLGDTQDAYVMEAVRTNRLLTLYEALLSKDIERLEPLLVFLKKSTPEAVKEEWRRELNERNESGVGKDGVFLVRDILEDMLIYDSPPSSWDAYLFDEALNDIWHIVGTALSMFAYPSIVPMGNSGPLTVDQLTSSWAPRNLLGAMYLQFYWLITSASALSRCKHCGRIISYAPPLPQSGKRKPRKDKVFCDERCRQNHHYHNRVKPARKRGDG